jgi:AraC family transcriptional regulator
MVPNSHPLTLTLDRCSYAQQGAGVRVRTTEMSDMSINFVAFPSPPPASAAARPIRGGLPAWQQKRVAEFIDTHLAEVISLATLAELVGLSVYHFARAFRRSFGTPPHRYHMARRMDRARALLQRPALSVTQIGIQLGFRETSSFTRGFRKFTGLTPTDYRRHQQG